MIFKIKIFVVKTFGGNSGGDKCIFPFNYQRTTHYTCTTSGRNDGLRWCATTSNYDTDGKYGFCIEQGKLRDIL